MRTELYLSNKIHYNCKKINKNDAYGQISYFLNVKKIQDLLKKEEKDKVEKEEGEQQEQRRVDGKGRRKKVMKKTKNVMRKYVLGQ